MNSRQRIVLRITALAGLAVLSFWAGYVMSGLWIWR